MTTRDDVEEALWKAEDVASYLKVSRSWVYHRAEEGVLPSLKVGGLLRFCPEAIRAFAKGGGSRAGRVVALPIPPRV
jgi:excisionase family DNA binding protein